MPAEPDKSEQCALADRRRHFELSGQYYLRTIPSFDFFDQLHHKFISMCPGEWIHLNQLDDRLIPAKSFLHKLHNPRCGLP